jgi:hypothetical protein
MLPLNPTDMWLQGMVSRKLSWIALLMCPHNDFTLASNHNLMTVPLIPFLVCVEWTISSPDLLHLALVEYIEENTIAENVTLRYNSTSAFENATECVEFIFTGSAEISNDFGSMTYALLQQEQRMIFKNMAELEPFVQDYYENAIRPFNGSIDIRFLLFLFTEATEAPSSEGDSMETTGDSFYSTTWFISAVALAAATGTVILVIVTVGCIKSRVQSWQTRLRGWKYNLDRERQLIPTPLRVEGEVAPATMNSSASADALDGVDVDHATSDWYETPIANP